MVDAEQGIFGEMFLQDGTLVEETLEYQIGETKLKIKAFGFELRKQLTHYS
jgi:hypothetical protein